MTDAPREPRSGSLINPRYWWYVARADLLEVTFGDVVPERAAIVDIGSADGPSVAWLDRRARRVPLDIDPGSVPPGGVCASALRLPFADASLPAVTAFDVVEHFEDDLALLTELRRVVHPGGRLLVSVPAYRWAWSSHDDAAGHHRRYSRTGLVTVLTAAGFTVERCTYAFAATLPFFAADRMRERLVGRPAQRVAVDALPRRIERLLLQLTRADAALLRRHDLPFGSSLFASAVRS